MTTDLEDQLATYFDWVEQSQPVAHTVATPPAHATAHPATARSHGERPTRWVLLAAAAVVAIVVAGLVALVRGPDTSAPSGPATAPTSTAPAPVREPFVPGAPAGGWFRFDLPAARLNSVVEVDVAVPLADGSADYVWADLAADPVRGMYVHVHAPLGPDESLPVPPDEGSPVDAPTGAAWFADVGLFHRLYWQQPDGTVLEAGGTNVPDTQLAEWLFALGDPPTHPDPTMHPVAFDTHDSEPRFTDTWSVGGTRMQALVTPADLGDVYAWGLMGVERVTVDATQGYRGTKADRTVVAWPLDATYWARLDIPAELTDRVDDLVAAVTVPISPAELWPTEWVAAAAAEVTDREIHVVGGAPELGADGPVAVWVDLAADPIRVMSLRIAVDVAAQLGDPTWRTARQRPDAPDGTAYAVGTGSIVWERADGTVVEALGTAVDDDQLAAWTYEIVTSGLIGEHPDPAFGYVPVAAGFTMPGYSETWQVDETTAAARAQADGLGVVLSWGPDSVRPIAVGGRQGYVVTIVSADPADPGERLLLVPLDAGYWATVQLADATDADVAALADTLRIAPMPMHPPDSGVVKGTLTLTGGPEPGTTTALAGTITFTPVGGTGDVSIAAAADGRFTARLAPGTYTIGATSPSYEAGNVSCIGAPPQITVTRGAHVAVDVACPMK